MLVRRMTLTIAPMLCACLEQRVEHAPPGSFVCAEQTDCEDGQNCILGVCEAMDGPRVEIRFPADFDRLVVGDAEQPIAIDVSLAGENLALVDPDEHAADELGTGYLDVAVDGEVVARVTAGDLAAGLVQQVPIAPTPGAHRITVVARTRSGARYDNLESRGTRLVWIDDGEPHVALARPWPGDELERGAITLEVQLATLNFELLPIDAQEPGWRGHAHLHYDEAFPACVSDPACDCCELAELAPYDEPYDGRPLRAIAGTVTLPAGTSGPATLTAILRDTADAPLLDGNGAYVFDTIELHRYDTEPDDG